MTLFHQFHTEAQRRGYSGLAAKEVARLAVARRPSGHRVDHDAATPARLRSSTFPVACRLRAWENSVCRVGPAGPLASARRLDYSSGRWRAARLLE
jgi:hypothetical protein